MSSYDSYESSSPSSSTKTDESGSSSSNNNNESRSRNSSESSNEPKSKRVLKMIPMKLDSLPDKPQNFNAAKLCPEMYIQCPRDCGFYILKQRKNQHVLSSECPLFKEKLSHEEKLWIKDQRDKPKKQAFVYGYTNKNGPKN